MILAAGLGKRMRAHNDLLPKPLVPVAGRPLLAYSLDLIRNAGLQGAVVNTHYKAEMIEAWLAVQDVNCTISHEEELLETGGGVAKALPLLAERFFVINSDVINLESDGATAPNPTLRASPCSVGSADQSLSLLQQMQSAWNDTAMDALLLLIPVEKAVGYRGAGDFGLAADGHLVAREEGLPAYVFTGVQLLHRRFLQDAPTGAFSLSPLYRKALEARPCRIFGFLHPGAWFHVGDGEGVREAEGKLSNPL